MEKPIQKRRRGRIALIVVAVLAVLLAGVLLFAGNYLFRFALDPQFGGMAHGYDPGEWELAGKNAWFTENAEDRWLESRDGLKLHALYLARPEQSHRYAVICHGYGSIPQAGGGGWGPVDENGVHNKVGF